MLIYKINTYILFFVYTICYRNGTEHSHTEFHKLVCSRERMIEKFSPCNINNNNKYHGCHGDGGEK